MRNRRIEVTEEMVYRAHALLREETNLPYTVNSQDFTREDVKNGKHQAALDEAERMNWDLVRRALEAACSEPRTIMDNIFPSPAWTDKLRKTWDENPLIVIGAASGACVAVARLIDAVSSAQGRRAYARQVNLKTKRRNS